MALFDWCYWIDVTDRYDGKLNNGKSSNAK